jgi:copper(I)-binding protein
MDNPIKKTFGISLLAACAVTALVGCGAGQISQTATQEPAINGTGASIDNLTLRNVHLQAVQTGDALQPGTDVDLIFTVSNQSADTDDRLVRITSEVGTVSLTGNTDLPANGVLEVGVPDGVDELAALPERADGAEAKVALSEPISNGLTYPFTFTFEQAGDQTVDVPISAGNAARQGEGGGSGHSGGGH